MGPERFVPVGDAVGPYQPATDTLLAADCLIRRLVNPSLSQALTARLRFFQGWRHPAALSLLHVQPDGDDLLLIYEAPPGVCLPLPPLPYREVVAALPAPLAALAALHSQGVAVGPLNPGCLLQTDFGWGIVPDVLPPAGHDDLAAIGSLLGELLAGRRELPSRFLNDHPELLYDGRPVPPLVDQLVAQLLDPDAAARPPGILEVCGRLEAAAEMASAPARAQITAPVLAAAVPPLSVPKRAGRTPDSSDRKVPGWAWGLIVLLAVAVTFGGLRMLRPAPRQAPPLIVHTPAAPPPAPEAVEPPSPIPPVTPAPPQPDPQAEALARAAADAAFEQLLVARGEAEAVNAADWAGEAWQKMLAVIKTGDDARAENRYADAAAAWTDAVGQARAIYAQRFDALTRLLADGAAALAAGGQAAALKAYTAALAIDPVNVDAARGLSRARTLDQVNKALAEAAQLEAQGAFGSARVVYTRALQLDGLAPGAKEAIIRLDATIADEAWMLAMQNGRKALADGDLEAAATAAGKAMDLNPNDRETIQLTAAIQLAIRRRDASLKLKAGGEAEAAEEWQQAYTRYQEAEKLDPGLIAASAGIARTARRNELSVRIEKYLDTPDMLLLDDTRRNAALLADEVQALPAPAAPRLAAKAAQLTAAVTRLAAPMPVSLTSDGSTSVDILRFQRLGSFSSRTLELPAGTYTAVGRRIGFQDVRITFTVKPGEPLPPIDIRCTVAF